MIKVVKITALWCSGCIIMNKVWNQIMKNYSIETISYDYDMDEEEVQTYSPGKVLPVFIFYQDEKEVKRLVGEHSYEEMESIIQELGD